MRTFVVLGVSLSFATAAGAQQRDSSYWTLGVSRGMVSTSRFAAKQDGSTGSLQVEWRRLGARLGVRSELSVAESEKFFANGFSGCATCFSDNRHTAVSGLASLIYEWRQERTLRPYVIAGAGIAHAQFKSRSNVDFGMGRLETPETFTRAMFSMVMAAGVGVSANLGRFSGFVESRARTGVLDPRETVSFGMRIRPD